MVYTWYSFGMEFEYDPVKSATNKEKHGLDFEEAKALWTGDCVELASKYADEPRQVVIGLVDGRHWTAITTRRGDRIRIISVRRSRDQEVQYYEDHQSRRT